MNIKLGGGFEYFLVFTPIPGEMIQFDEHIFGMGWHHQLEQTWSFLCHFLLKLIPTKRSDAGNSASLCPCWDGENVTP